MLCPDFEHRVRPDCRQDGGHDVAARARQGPRQGRRACDAEARAQQGREALVVPQQGRGHGGNPSHSLAHADVPRPHAAAIFISTSVCRCNLHFHKRLESRVMWQPTDGVRNAPTGCCAPQEPRAGRGFAWAARGTRCSPTHPEPRRRGPVSGTLSARAVARGRAGASFVFGVTRLEFCI
eukprot:3514909-Rhodomonas_salina.3